MFGTLGHQVAWASLIFCMYQCMLASVGKIKVPYHMLNGDVYIVGNARQRLQLDFPTQEPRSASKLQELGIRTQM